MRPFYLLLTSLSLLALVACGTEEDLTPPAFSNVEVIGSLDRTINLTAPFQEDTVTIRGYLADFAASLVANSTATGEIPLVVDSSDGGGSFTFSPKEGPNTVTLTASDDRGNINQMILSMTHDTIAPAVISVRQDVDPLQLVITFSESLQMEPDLEKYFLIDGVAVTGTAELSAANTVTLPALSAGLHTLVCDGIKDLSTPNGNSISDMDPFEFTIE